MSERIGTSLAGSKTESRRRKQITQSLIICAKAVAANAATARVTASSLGLAKFMGFMRPF